MFHYQESSNLIGNHEHQKERLLIPNIIHFIYFGGKPFSLIHFLAVKSAYVVNKPEAIFLYYNDEPGGEWWENARPYLTLVKMDAPVEVSGVPLYHVAHQSDVARLQILLAHGGIYLDIDVICVKPFTPLLRYSCVLGQQERNGAKGVGNAVILTEKNAFFAQKWLEGFDPHKSYWRGFRSEGHDAYWDELSVRYPAYLSTVFPEHICVQDYQRFYELSYHIDDLKIIHEQQEGIFEHAYCHHLWQSVAWKGYLKDLTIESLRDANTNFAQIVKPFLI